MDLKEVDLFFDDNPNPMWIYDLDSLKIIEVNEAALSQYGYSRQEMLSLTIKDLRPEEEVPKLLQFLQKNPERYEDAGVWRHISKENEIIYLHILSHPVKIDGRMCELIVARNVTNQVETQARLSEEQRTLKLITENLPGTFFALDERGNILRWNKYTERISGYSQKEISEMNALDFFSEDERPVISQAIQKVLAEGYAEVQSNLLSKSGSRIPIYFKGNTMKIGEEVRIVGIGIDISNLVEAEKNALRHQQLLQAIIDQSKSVIFIKDKEGRFKFVNKQFLSLFDVDASEVIGKRDSELIDEDDLQAMHQSDKQVWETGKPVEIEEHLRVDGETKIYLTTKVLLKGIDQYENCVFGLSTDITERKKMEDELKESLEEKQVLLSEIHHRVKNNLAIISGMMELEAMESDNSDLRRKLYDSQSRIMSIATTHEILYKEQNFSSVDFSTNIEKLVNSLAETFDANVEINFDLKPVKLNINQAIPCSLLVNEIITNALKHAFTEFDEDEEPVIEIEVFEQNGRVNLTVQDNGKGLPFDYDIDRSESLGLKLVNVLKTQLNASLEVDTDQGTLFKISFEKNNVKGIGSTLPEYSNN